MKVSNTYQLKRVLSYPLYSQITYYLMYTLDGTLAPLFIAILGHILSLEMQ